MNVRERQAFAYFVSMGWSPAQSAGIVANLVAESGLNPAAVGDGGLAYGIAQHHPDRQANFATAMGEPIHGSSLESQLAFVHWELQHTEKAAGDALRACTTASAAGAYVSRLYERPADREGEARRRGALAETLLTQWQPEAPQIPPQADPGPIPATPSPEHPMGALAVPFLQMILSPIFARFGQQAQTAVSKVTGAAPDVAGAFLQNIIGQVSAAAGVPITDQSTAIQAVAAVTKPEAAAKIEELEAHTLDYLDKLGPVFDKINQYDKDAWAAEEASRNAAAERALAQQREGPLYNNPTFIIAMLIIFLVFVVVGAVLFKGGFSTDMQAFVIGAVVGSALTAVLSFYFGSSRNSAAKDATISQLANK